MATSFRPRRRGISYSEALAAAYASAPEAEIILDTLEFRHTSFKDSEGNPVAPRIVNDHEPFLAYLEATAPLNGGEEVTFQPVRFRFARPHESDDGNAPTIQLTIDNVARLLIPYLDQAKDSPDLITVTWRPYLVSDPSTPHMDPVLTLTLTSVTADMSSVSATASFADLVNRRFPAIEYVASKFPGLVAR